MDPVPERLIRNLRALSRTQPDLAERLTWPCADDHVIESDTGPHLVRPGKEPALLAWPRARLTADVAGLPPRGEVLAFGVGTGDAWFEALEARPDGSLYGWDRDPWLLRRALSHHDVSRPISQGRLRLGLGADLHSYLHGMDRRPRTLMHPLLGEVYELERRVLHDPARAARPVAALACGTLFVEDLATATEGREWTPWPIDLDAWSRQELRQALDTLCPETVIAVNYKTGLAELCREAERPLCVWEIDPCLDRSPVLEGAADGTRIFTWRRANVAAFESAGFANVEHLPLATDPVRRAPLELDATERAACHAPVAFVGASMVEQASRLQRRFLEHAIALDPDGADAHGAIEATLQEVLAAQRADPDHDLVPTLARERFGPFLERARAAGVDEDPILWLSEVAAAERRLGLVATLAPFGIEVWGDRGWERLADQGVPYRSAADHGRELTAIYQSSDVHVDIGRLYQRDIVTMRVFDVLASGGFVLAEWSEDLAELLEPGLEVATWRTAGELVAKTRHYLECPEEREAIAARGREAVRAKHTIAQRLEHMLGSRTAPRARR